MVGVKRGTLYKHTTVFNNEHLHGDLDEGHDKEVNVVEESFENVEFTLTKLSGIDLVEDLHEYERLEDHGEQVKSRCRLVTTFVRQGNGRVVVMVF